MQRSNRANRTVVFLGFLGTALITACSGGGGSSSAPHPNPTLGGIGGNIAFDQRVNFTVIVPPPATANAVAIARRKHTVAGSTVTNPYVSAKTASVSLQIGTVNGQSPRTLPASVTINVACPGNNGCSVPIQNVPAAKGVDRFAVQTFSGPDGTGNVISSGFIDVTVPSATATSFGGTGLTIGGFVQSLSLALNVPNGPFRWNTPATGTIDVNALDPAGAIIIGNDQLANAIQVTLPDSNHAAFTLNGSPQLTLQASAQSIALSYSGAELLSGTVNASTTDANGQPVATSLPIPIQPPTPTPRPSPTPTLVGATPPPPLSLYVYDANADRIIEYGGVISVEGGSPFSATPRRVFEVAAPPALSPNLNCAFAGSPFLSNMAVRSDGTIYAQTFCNDVATASQAYTFTYAASTQETAAPQASPTPPVPTSTFSVTVDPYVAPIGIKLDEAHSTVFLQYDNASFGSGHILGVPMSNPTNPTTNFGDTCLQAFSQPGSCIADQGYAFQSGAVTFGVDTNGFIYLPSSYGSATGNNQPIVPPGPAAEEFAGEPAVVVFPSGLTNSVATPFSALAGFHNELGGYAAPEMAIEGSELYVLASPGQISAPVTGDQVNSGLSGCPAPSPNALPDTTTDLCANQGSATYLAGFPNATQTLTSPGNAATDVLSPPGFMIGGDIVGGFGSTNNADAIGDTLVVKDSFAYVLNESPPTGGTPEIDVYDLHNVTGFHTDIQPLTRFVLDPTIFPTTIAIGPTGTGVGGQALMRRPARVHRDIRAWIRKMQQRRQSQLRAHGLIRP